jgi:hypothetical protein
MCKSKKPKIEGPQVISTIATGAPAAQPAKPVIVSTGTVSQPSPFAYKRKTDFSENFLGI